MTTVVLDASVLINLAIIARFDLLTLLSGFVFVAPTGAFEDILRPEQRVHVESAVRSGVVRLVEMDESETADFVRFTAFLDQGESACLAVAVRRGFSLATDDRRALKKAANQELGTHRLLRTPDILLLAIRAKAITIAQADVFKAVLAANKFTVSFGSFAELLRPSSQTESEASHG